jgi:hypothetical protein
MENTIPVILKDAFDEDFDQRRRKAGKEAGGQEAGPAHCFWDALISVRSFNHPESHGKPSMAFLFSEKKKIFTAECAETAERTIQKTMFPKKRDPGHFDSPLRSGKKISLKPSLRDLRISAKIRVPISFLKEELCSRKPGPGATFP